MQGKEVGAVRVREGEKDGQWFYLGAMADSKHTSLMLNSWGTTTREGPIKKRRVGQDLVTMQHPQYLHIYYQARHAVDDNNNNRQGVLAFEESFAPKRWDLRQLGFVIALALTNSLLAYNSFVREKKGQPPMSNAQFRRELAREMVEYYSQEEKVAQDEELSLSGKRPLRSRRIAVSILGCL